MLCHGGLQGTFPTRADSPRPSEFQNIFFERKKKQHAQTHANFLKSWLCPNFSCCPNVTGAVRVEAVANGKNRDRDAGQFKQNLIGTKTGKTGAIAPLQRA